MTMMIDDDELAIFFKFLSESSSFVSVGLDGWVFCS
jgi:hypothetical protein